MPHGFVVALLSILIACAGATNPGPPPSAAAPAPAAAAGDDAWATYCARWADFDKRRAAVAAGDGQVAMLRAQVPGLRRELDALLREGADMNARVEQEQRDLNRWESQNPTWGNPGLQQEADARRAELKRHREIAACAEAKNYAGEVRALEAALATLEADEQARVATAQQSDAFWESLRSPPTESSLQGREVVQLYDKDIQKLFIEAHRERFVFARKQIEVPYRARVIQRGEALLVVRADALNMRDAATVLSLDGFTVDVKKLDLALAPLPGANPVALKAEFLDVKAGGASGGYADLVTVKTQGAALYGPPKFLALAPDHPRVAAFLAERDKTIACYDKVMAKLDPDNRRSNFDIVTYKNGEMQKVESMSSRYDRQACSKCNCKGLNVSQRALAKEIIAPLQQQRLETEFEPALKRLRGVFAKQ